MRGLVFRLCLAAVAAVGLGLNGSAVAQTHPTGPVRIIVGTGPGSSPDVIARVIADHLSKSWKQQVIVENRPGGAGAVAIRAVGNSAPDGLTLYMALASNFISPAETRAKFAFDLSREFVPIGYVGEHPMVIGVSPELGVNTLSEFVALAKSRKGGVNFSAGNNGSMWHLASEWFRSATGAEMTLVHYAGAAQALPDVLGGRVQGIGDAISGLRPAIANGSLKALAVAAEKPLYNFPDIPPVADMIPGFQAMGWFALLAPPGTPDSIASQYSDDLRAVLTDAALKKRYEDLGTYLRPMTGNELAAFIAAQQKLWEPVLAKIGPIRK